MNLNNFEEHMDKKILARGLGYYRFSRVSSLEKVDKNLHKAEVEGTDELYYVEVELDEEGNILFSECDCPYDMEEYCKHQAAVFYALKKMADENLKIGETENKANNISSKIRPKNFKAKKEKDLNIKKVLSNKSKNELIEFLDSLASEYEEIKRRIELNFGTENNEEELESCIKLIQAYIRQHSDNYGFVNHREIHGAVQGAEIILEKARDAYIDNEPIHALELSLCVAREMVQLLQHGNDSDGIIGGIIDDVFLLLDDIIEDEDIDLPKIELIFNKLIEESSRSRYDEWPDWQIELLEKCSLLACTADLRNVLEKHLQEALEKEKGNAWSTNYFAEQINLIRYNIIKIYEGNSKAKEFINQNLHYPNFRKMAIWHAMKNNDYQQVEKLAKEGETNDKHLPGLLSQWKELRYEAYKKSRQLEKQRKLAEEFILEGQYKYYKDLKNTYNKKEWNFVYPQIISALENKEEHSYRNVYTQILIEEGEKKKLLNHVKKQPSKIEKYWKHLVPDYKEEVYAVFSHYIEQKAAVASNRKNYQEVCHIIRLLKKAGGHEQAREIIQLLLNKYPKKPAFRDELLKI